MATRSHARDLLQRAAERDQFGLRVARAPFTKTEILQELVLARANQLRADRMEGLGDLDLAIRAAYEAILVACQAVLHATGIDAVGEGAHGSILRGARGYLREVGRQDAADAVDLADKTLRPLRNQIAYHHPGTSRPADVEDARRLAQVVVPVAVDELTEMLTLTRAHLHSHADARADAETLPDAIDHAARISIGYRADPDDTARTH